MQRRLNAAAKLKNLPETRTARPINVEEYAPSSKVSWAFRVYPEEYPNKARKSDLTGLTSP